MDTICDAACIICLVTTLSICQNGSLVVFTYISGSRNVTARHGIMFSLEHIDLVTSRVDCVDSPEENLNTPFWRDFVRLVVTIISITKLPFDEHELRTAF